MTGKVGYTIVFSGRTEKKKHLHVAHAKYASFHKIIKYQRNGYWEFWMYSTNSISILSVPIALKHPVYMEPRSLKVDLVAYIKNALLAMYTTNVWDVEPNWRNKRNSDKFEQNKN